MTGEERRSQILKRLNESDQAVSATSLAGEFSITRQIIVADIALLRASGHSIKAERRGYVMEKPDGKSIFKRIVVKHGMEGVQEEFYAIVDNGGKVLDVIVEHNLYGMISVKIDVSNRYDADNFVAKIKETGANPLSILTEGLHVHTISVKDEQSFERIVSKLRELNIYVESN